MNRAMLPNELMRIIRMDCQFGVHTYVTTEKLNNKWIHKKKMILLQIKYQRETTTNHVPKYFLAINVTVDDDISLRCILCGLG